MYYMQILVVKGLSRSVGISKMTLILKLMHDSYIDFFRGFLQFLKYIDYILEW